MKQTVAEYAIERLEKWGIDRIFGYPGDGINGFMSALRKAENKIQFIPAVHEELCAFMATGHAKFTGETAVCMATSGPGAIHLLNGLYDAKMDHQPVVAIIGQQARAAMGGSYQQEVDLVSLFKDVAGDYVHMATTPAQVRHLIDRAIRIATAERTVTCIIFPNDLQEEPYEEPKHLHGTIHSSIGYTAPVVVPPAAALQQAADILNEGKKIAMLVGAGAFNAVDELIEIANLLQAGIAKALLAKAILPDDLPYVTGSIGLLGTTASWEMMKDCDTLLMIGSGFPYSEYLPEEGKAKAIQIDIDGKMLGIRYPMDVHLEGDSKATLQQLMPLIKQKEDKSWREEIEKNVKKWWEITEARADNNASPINPQYLFLELSKLLPDNCIISADSGTSASWFARDLKMRKGMKASLSGNLATMCPAVPYSIAAKFAYPERTPIALIGDGAMQMLGINGLLTIARYWKTWKNPSLIILVLNNRDLNMVSWEQRVMIGDAKFDVSQEVIDTPYEEFARMLGLEGIRIEKKEEVIPALEQAMRMNKPVVINAYTDPSVPVLPPHISFDQMKGMASSMLKGDTNTWDMIKQSSKEVFAGLFPGKENK